jgi:hypothetical protein
MTGPESLLNHIHFRLAVKKYCIVSERELERAWPMDTKREAAIMEFSRLNNLDAAIVDGPQLRVRFKKLPAL